MGRANRHYRYGLARMKIGLLGRWFTFHLFYRIMPELLNLLFSEE